MSSHRWLEGASQEWRPCVKFSKIERLGSIRALSSKRSFIDFFWELGSPATSPSFRSLGVHGNASISFSSMKRLLLNWTLDVGTSSRRHSRVTGIATEMPSSTAGECSGSPGPTFTNGRVRSFAPFAPSSPIPSSIAQPFRGLHCTVRCDGTLGSKDWAGRYTMRLGSIPVRVASSIWQSNGLLIRRFRVQVPGGLPGTPHASGLLYFSGPSWENHRTPCGCGGIGRRARFRTWYREMWEFESPHPHRAPKHGITRTYRLRSRAHQESAPTSV